MLISLNAENIACSQCIFPLKLQSSVATSNFCPNWPKFLHGCFFTYWHLSRGRPERNSIVHFFCIALICTLGKGLYTYLISAYHKSWSNEWIMHQFGHVDDIPSSEQPYDIYDQTHIPLSCMLLFVYFCFMMKTQRLIFFKLSFDSVYILFSYNEKWCNCYICAV